MEVFQRVAKAAEVLTRPCLMKFVFLNNNKNNNVNKGYYPAMGKIAVSQQHAKYTWRKLQSVKKMKGKTLM